MLEDILINLGVSSLLVAIKNPKRKAQLRSTFLKVYRAIKVAFAGDPDFE